MAPRVDGGRRPDSGVVVDSEQDAGSGGDFGTVAELLTGPIVAIGDSIMAWNDGQEVRASIPAVAGRRLSVDVENRAVGSSFFLDPAEGIPTQYVGGEWSWLLLNGGGNDLNETCGCDVCAQTLDELVSVDGQTGAIARFVDQVRALGVKVAFVGYYDLPEGAFFGFDACDDELEVLRSRVSRLAAARDGVIYVDARDAVSAADLTFYSEDRVHPSIAGSAAVGELVAERILNAP